MRDVEVSDESRLAQCVASLQPRCAGMVVASIVNYVCEMFVSAISGALLSPHQVL